MLDSSDDKFDAIVAIAETFEYVMDPVRARDILKSLGDGAVALDFETTSLSPKMGEVRLSCIYDGKKGYLLDHFSCGSFNKIAPLFRPQTWLVYNGKFERRWFHYALKDFDYEVWDIDFMAKSVMGGGFSSLKIMAKRALDIDMDKTLQNSDWSDPDLTEGQLVYAAFDAVVTWEIAQHWKDKMDEGHWDGFHVLNDCTEATIECEDSGLYLDEEVHVANVAKWNMKHENALRTIRRFTPKSIIDNLNSNKQVSDFLKTQLDSESLSTWPTTGKRGDLSLDRKTLAPIAAKAPYPFSRWLNAFILYRYYSKYLSTYGNSLLTKSAMTGGIVTYRLNIAQAGTGRYSSSSINIQNIPRKPFVRRAFYAPPELGEEMVLADYSGIELRVLAEISGDEKLKEDVIYGNVHASSAATINVIDENKFLAIIDNEDHKDYYKYKELRNQGKGFSFQLTYGAGPPALSLVLKCEVEEAIEAVQAWARRYPKAYGYRNIIFDEMERTGFIPVVDGRTIYVPKLDRSMPVAANYGIQGAAASVMMRAVYHVHRMLHASNYLAGKARIAASVHDEILMYCTKGYGDYVKEMILIPAMEQGWLDVFPDTSIANLIESAVGDSWAAKP